MLRRCSPSLISAGKLLCAGLLCFGLAACAGEVTASGDPSLVIEIQPGSVSVENRTGSVLVDTEMQLMPLAFPRPYFNVVGRLSNGEKRTFTFDQFRMADGTPYRLGAKLSSVKVVGKDVSGKQVEREVPFK